MAPYHLVAFALSDVGLIRENNEDVWLTVPEIGLFILADGMGGHLAGEVASFETATLLAEKIKKKLTFPNPSSTLSDFKQELQRSIQEVNEKIYEMSCQKEECYGMGTTLCCLLFHPEGVVCGHVGDSRIYRLREKTLDILTQDHSLVKRYLDFEEIYEDKKTSYFQYKNIITKAVGTEPKIEPALDVLSIEKGDLYLMCSDGLTDLLYQEEIECILNKAANVEQASLKLVEAAKGRGGHDNITVVLVQVT